MTCAYSFKWPSRCTYNNIDAGDFVNMNSNTITDLVCFIRRSKTNPICSVIV